MLNWTSIQKIHSSTAWGGGEEGDGGWSYGFSALGIWLSFERYFGILIKNETVFSIPTTLR